MTGVQTCALPIFAPHVGSATHETRNEMGRVTVDNLLAHFAGKPVLTPVG